MHEYGIAEQIFEITENVIGDRSLCSVLRIEVQLGSLSGVNSHSLQFCFSSIAKQKGLDSLLLDLICIPTRARCCSCRCEYELQDLYQLCPNCMGYTRQYLTGYEMNISSIEFKEVAHV